VTAGVLVNIAGFLLGGLLYGLLLAMALGLSSFERLGRWPHRRCLGEAVHDVTAGCRVPCLHVHCDISLIMEPRRSPLRIVVADDERPARLSLVGLLAECEDVLVIGEAQNGAEAIQLIERERPDLALLDLQMPEVDGLSVVRLIRRDRLPLVAFVTAYDEHAIQAFEMNAVDYLLKPVDRGRLRQMLERARDRLEARAAGAEAMRVRQAASEYSASSPATPLTRIPVRRREDIVLVPVAQVASVVADGELLHLTTKAGEKHTISYRLKDLEARLDPARFVRVERGALVNIEAIARVSPLPGGVYLLSLTNGQELRASRLQSRILREQLLRL
jgi:two-component system, LytTR family, response regulator